MMMRHQGLSVFLASLALLLPGLVLAQSDLGNLINTFRQLETGTERHWLSPPNERRAYVEIANDWRDTVRLTMWTKRGERIGSAWTIRSGQTGLLKDEGHRITATADYNIRVGDDPATTSVGDVGERRGDMWHIRVRDIWQATHSRGRYDREGRGIDQGGGIDQGE
jgi:hypothetical protein